jgi:hypothetical protein
VAQASCRSFTSSHYSPQMLMHVWALSCSLKDHTRVNNLLLLACTAPVMV